MNGDISAEYYWSPDSAFDQHVEFKTRLEQKKLLYLFNDFQNNSQV